jgi:hypothetical protein
MKRLHLIALACTVATLSALPVRGPAQSSGGPYRIDASVIAGGGASLSGSTFRLRGTVGQTATTRLAAGSFRLYSGFWAPAGPESDEIFANGFDP